MSIVKVSVERSQTDKARSRTNAATGEIEYQQPVWVYRTFSKHPTEFVVRLPAGVKLYPEGDYFTDIQANMVADKYQGMSVNPFSPMVLVPATPPFVEFYDKLQAQLVEQFNKLPR